MLLWRLQKVLQGFLQLQRPRTHAFEPEAEPLQAMRQVLHLGEQFELAHKASAQESKLRQDEQRSMLIRPVNQMGSVAE